MSFIEEQVLIRLQELPDEQKREVLNFVDFLHHKYVPRVPYESAMGIFEDLGLHLSEEEIDAARRELWAMSPGVSRNHE